MTNSEYRHAKAIRFSPWDIPTERWHRAGQEIRDWRWKVDRGYRHEIWSRPQTMSARLCEAVRSRTIHLQSLKDGCVRLQGEAHRYTTEAWIKLIHGQAGAYLGAEAALLEAQRRVRVALFWLRSGRPDLAERASQLYRPEGEWHCCTKGCNRDLWRDPRVFSPSSFGFNAKCGFCIEFEEDMRREGRESA